MTEFYLCIYVYLRRSLVRELSTVQRIEHNVLIAVGMLGSYTRVYILRPVQHNDSVMLANKTSKNATIVRRSVAWDLYTWGSTIYTQHVGYLSPLVHIFSCVLVFISAFFEHTGTIFLR